MPHTARQPARHGHRLLAHVGPGDRLHQTQAITGYLEWPVAPIAYFMSILAGLSALLIVMLLWRAVAGRPYPAYDDGGGELSA